MKKRILAGVLFASLAFSSTPVQAAPTGWLGSVVGYFIKQHYTNQVLESIRTGAEKYEKEFIKAEQIMAVSALAVLVYFGLNALLSRSTKEGVGLFDLMVGVPGLGGWKCDPIQGNINKGSTFWRSLWKNENEEQVAQAAEAVKTGAEGVRTVAREGKKVANGLLDALSILAFGPKEDAQQAPIQSQANQEQPQLEVQQNSGQAAANEGDQAAVVPAPAAKAGVIASLGNWLFGSEEGQGAPLSEVKVVEEGDAPQGENPSDQS